MDLHEKIALRRKEREIETAAALAKVVVHQAEQSQAAEQAARRQLAEEGFPVNNDSLKVIERLALERMAFWETAICIIFSIAGVISLFGSVLTGIFLLAVTGWFLHSRIEKYKRIIIMESAAVVEAKTLLKNF
jgi:hypothetical protein